MENLVRYLVIQYIIYKLLLLLKHIIKYFILKYGLISICAWALDDITQMHLVECVDLHVQGAYLIYRHAQPNAFG